MNLIPHIRFIRAGRLSPVLAYVGALGSLAVIATVTFGVGR